MIQQLVKPNSVDVCVIIRILDEATGAPETGVVAATSGLDLKYRRELAAAVDLTESDLAALTTAHADGGIKHIGAGYYRVDLPDAAVAAGVAGVLVFGTVTGMQVIGCYVQLAPVGADITHLLGTAHLAPGTAGTPDVNTKLAGGVAWGSGALTLAAIAADLRLALGMMHVGTAAAIADGTITLEAGHGITNTTIVVFLRSGTNAKGKSRTATYSGAGDVFNVDPAWNDNGETTPSGTILYVAGIMPPTTLAFLAALFTEDSGVDFGDAVPGSVVKEIADNAIGGGLDAAGVRAAVGLAAPDLDGQLGAIDAKTTNLPSDPADASVLAGLIAAVEAKVDIVDALIDAIKAKTDNLPSDPADASVIAGLIAAAEAKIDIIDTIVDAITAKTTNLPSDPADASVLAGLIAAAEAKIDILDTLIDAITAGTTVVSANIKEVNDVALQGDGSAGDKWRPV